VQGHATSTEVSPTRHEAERFAEQIRDYVCHAHSERRFETLWMVAPPSFLGILRDKLGKVLHGAIELEVNKDVPTLAPDAIRDVALAERERQATRESRLKR
jgi:protein required for attachment to host cells